MTNRVLIAAVLALWAGSAHARSYNVAHSSEVSFTAKITGGSFVAKSQAVSGTVDYDDATSTIKAATIIVKADSFESGMTTRDEHMRDKYLEAKQHPEIRLEVKSAKVALTPGAETDVDGTLVIKGNRRAVKLKVTIASTSPQIGITSKFPVNITDYGIAQPKFAVVKMETTVEVAVKINFFRTGN
jgi:polyisoprenoid-binding protein YceI